jgi:uracil-DNA glycosylase
MEIFKAFDLCRFYDTRVVILGQDPYHGVGQANGLCFSVNENISLPPSLHNILKEVARDTNTEVSKNGNLERWAKQGVLMLNSILTVRAGEPGSHANRGWERFSTAVIVALNKELHNLVFLLWGAFAQKTGCLIDRSKHLALETTHPSPFSAHRGFMGCGHFTKTNSYLQEHFLPPIVW